MSPLLPLVAVFLSALLGLSGPARAETNADLGRGWMLLEQGKPSRARQHFRAAFERSDQRDAELYFAISLCWWRERNALASWTWLKDAVRLRDEWDWQERGNEPWDRRIDARIRWMEVNFTAVRLVLPRGEALAPLPDPLPPDPELAAFARALDEELRLSIEAGERSVLVHLPVGSYWVGDELVELERGGFDAHKPLRWRLPPADRAARAAWERRREARDAGESEAAAVLAERHSMERRARLRERALAQPPVMAWSFPVVGHEQTPRVNDELSIGWQGAGFELSYSISCADPDDRHGFEFPEAGFAVYIEDAELRVQGRAKARRKLGETWSCGPTTFPN